MNSQQFCDLIIRRFKAILQRSQGDCREILWRLHSVFAAVLGRMEIKLVVMAQRSQKDFEAIAKALSKLLQ
jgi:hypothetical protein